MSKIKFFNVDNRVFMKDKPDNYYDLVVIDPPYGIGEDGKKNHSRGKKLSPQNTHLKTGTINHLIKPFLKN